MTKEQHYKNFAEALLKVSKVKQVTFGKHCSETVISLIKLQAGLISYSKKMKR